MTLKTTLTPSEHANVVQGMQYPVQLSTGRVATPTAAAILASYICDGPMAIRNLRMNLGTGGTSGTTTVLVKKNGTTVITGTIVNTETDPINKVALPTDDIGPACIAGDVVTIEIGTAAGSLANLDATVHLDKMFS